MAVTKKELFDLTVRSSFLPEYADDAAFEAAYGTLVENLKYWNTTTKKTRVYDGTVWADDGAGSNVIQEPVTHYLEVGADIQAIWDIYAGKVIAAPVTFKFVDGGESVSFNLPVDLVCPNCCTVGSGMFLFLGDERASAGQPISIPTPNYVLSWPDGLIPTGFPQPAGCAFAILDYTLTVPGADFPASSLRIGDKVLIKHLVSEPYQQQVFTEYTIADIPAGASTDLVFTELLPVDGYAFIVSPSVVLTTDNADGEITIRINAQPVHIKWTGIRFNHANLDGQNSVAYRHYSGTGTSPDDHQAEYRIIRSHSEFVNSITASLTGGGGDNRISFEKVTILGGLQAENTGIYGRLLIVSGVGFYPDTSHGNIQYIYSIEAMVGIDEYSRFRLSGVSIWRGHLAVGRHASLYVKHLYIEAIEYLAAVLLNEESSLHINNDMTITAASPLLYSYGIYVSESSKVLNGNITISNMGTAIVATSKAVIGANISISNCVNGYEVDEGASVTNFGGILTDVSNPYNIQVNRMYADGTLIRDYANPTELTFDVLIENRIINLFSGEDPTPYLDALRGKIIAPGHMVTINLFDDHPFGVDTQGIQGGVLEFIGDTRDVANAVIGAAERGNMFNNGLDPEGFGRGMTAFVVGGVDNKELTITRDTPCNFTISSLHVGDKVQFRFPYFESNPYLQTTITNIEPDKLTFADSLGSGTAPYGFAILPNKRLGSLAVNSNGPLKLRVVGVNLGAVTSGNPSMGNDIFARNLNTIILENVYAELIQISANDALQGGSRVSSLSFSSDNGELYLENLYVFSYAFFGPSASGYLGNIFMVGGLSAFSNNKFMVDVINGNGSCGVILDAADLYTYSELHMEPSDNVWGLLQYGNSNYVSSGYCTLVRIGDRTGGGIFIDGNGTFSNAIVQLENFGEAIWVRKSGKFSASIEYMIACYNGYSTFEGGKIYNYGYTDYTDTVNVYSSPTEVNQYQPDGTLVYDATSSVEPTFKGQSAVLIPQSHTVANGETVNQYLDLYRNKILLAPITLNMESGAEHDFWLDFRDLHSRPDFDLSGSVEENGILIKGDTHWQAGITFVKDENIGGYPFLGDGIVSFLVVGNDIAVSRTSSNPVFDYTGMSLEYLIGKKILVRDSSYVDTELTVSAVSANVITTVEVPPANILFVTILPDWDSSQMLAQEFYVNYVPDVAVTFSGMKIGFFIQNGVETPHVLGRIRFHNMVISSFYSYTGVELVFGRPVYHPFVILIGQTIIQNSIMFSRESALGEVIFAGGITQFFGCKLIFDVALFVGNVDANIQNCEVGGYQYRVRKSAFLLTNCRFVPNKQSNYNTSIYHDPDSVLHALELVSCKGLIQLYAQGVGLGGSGIKLRNSCDMYIIGLINGFANSIHVVDGARADVDMSQLTNASAYAYYFENYGTLVEKRGGVGPDFSGSAAISNITPTPKVATLYLG